MTGLEPATSGATTQCSNQPELHPPLIFSAPRGIRTPDPRLRRPLLYPTELWALINHDARSTMHDTRCMMHDSLCTIHDACSFFQICILHPASCIRTCASCIGKWSGREDLNLRPQRPKRRALPTALRPDNEKKDYTLD